MTKIKREIHITDNISIVIKSDSKIDMAQAHTEAKLITKIASVVDSVQGTVSSIREVAISDSYNRWTEEDIKKLVKLYKSQGKDKDVNKIAKTLGREKNKVQNKIWHLKKAKKLR